ncbi:MAG TPA: hypothetical protein VNE39_26525 [Planctomycetota bacterium]|nr:hypothetical protein [Planctomycetota bacterium]
MHFAFCLLSSPSFAEKFHDTPPGGPGGLRIAVQPIADLEEAIVVEATEYKTYLAEIDRGSGTVSLRGLSPGRYDLVLKFKDKVCEGLTLVPPDGVQPIPKASRDGIKEVTWMSEDYFNEKHLIRSAGNPGTVKLLVEQVRDKKTFEPDGTVLQGILIRRLDLCELRRTRDIWQVRINRHLFREERKIGGPGTRLDFYHVPALGGARVGDEVVTLPVFDAAKLKAPRPAEASYREKPGGSPKTKPKRKP